MAEEKEEEVVVIEDDTENKESETEGGGNSDEVKEENDKKQKKMILIVVILLLVVIIFLLILLFVVVKKKRDEAQKIAELPKNQIEKITKKLRQKHIQQTTINQLVKKANILFSKGEHQKALTLLNKLSVYSESLSNYNLGVIQIKEKNYKKAIEYFNKAIANQDNRCVSAINGAYCCLKLGDKKRFQYYTHLAELYLPDESRSKSYPFYYALIHYYLGREFEALAGLEKSKNYLKESKNLKSAIYNLYNDPYKTIDNSDDDFILGISYARIGEYQLAEQHLEKVAMGFPLKAGVALALVNLKLHQYKSAAKNLNYAKNNDKIVYPIKVFLKKELFDIELAQKRFKEQFLTESEWFDIILYYAQYKVFNIKQTIDYLQKGSFGIALDDIIGANKYLTKSATISSLNVQMSKGIKLALNHHILPATKIFEKLVKKNPYHSILHYDLGINYAKLRKYRQSYYHFLRAYHLDSTNYLAGIFAIIEGEKASIKKDSLDRITMSLNGDIDFTNPKNKIYSALLSLIGRNYSDSLSWVESNPKNIKFNLAIELATLYLLDEKNMFAEKSAILKKIAPKDIISNLLYFYSTHSTDNIKKFALDFQPIFLTSLKQWDLKSFYYGSAIAVDLYLKFAKISGELPKVKEDLEKVLLNNSDDLIPVLQNLAFVNLFTKNFEQSYTIFNDLIDNKHIQDDKTLFYGAVSSIVAGHHSNGIALLSLSKRVNKNEFEARYGLGLLYHEAKNLRGATIQYNLIPTGFESKFFDFEVIP